VGLIMRPSESALSNVGRAIASSRNHLVRRWADWITQRTAQAPQFDRPTVERQLGLLIDIVIEMTAPLRRDAAQLWFDACEHYGRSAATRGLAAGEVVEEIQHLRELLIRELSEIIAALPARHSMATVLRLNRQVDRGIAQAVVGYTDALVETLFSQRGVPVSAPESIDTETLKRIEQLESDLARLREQHRVG
jgi:hypothetical protein